MESSKKYYFYVVECVDGSYYAGYTTNVENRIKTHNDGKGAKYTRGRTPISLLFYKVYDSKSEALKAEINFKRLSRKRKEAIIAKELGEKNVATEKLPK
ncbi:GIY-YIG nuclease family protein [Bacillus timonensis]|nr:GIY-YIG nuclease family protein [Bacillus timonensis]